MNLQDYWRTQLTHLPAHERAKGKTPLADILCRTYGALWIGLVSLPLWTEQSFREIGDNLPYRIIFGLVTAYCSADILTGEHHCLVSRLEERAGRKPWPDGETDE